jgi:hypothetical protein
MHLDNLSKGRLSKTGGDFNQIQRNYNPQNLLEMIYSKMWGRLSSSTTNSISGESSWKHALSTESRAVRSPPGVSSAPGSRRLLLKRSLGEVRFGGMIGTR